MWLAIRETVREVLPFGGCGVVEWPVQSLKAVPDRANDSTYCFCEVFFSFFSTSLAATFRLRAPRADMATMVFQRRVEKLTGGAGDGGSSDSDRQ